MFATINPDLMGTFPSPQERPAIFCEDFFYLSFIAVHAAKRLTGSRISALVA